MKKFLFLLVAIFSIATAQAQNYNLLVGTYTNKGNSEGIYVFDFNTATAETNLKSITKTTNPSYLTVSKDKKFVYSVNEDGKNSGVSSFRFDSKSGVLNFIDKKFSGEADPCFIVTNGNRVLTANYSGGSVSVFKVASNGKFLTENQVIKHTGNSIDPKRQLNAHAHQISLLPNNQYVVTDLGEDKIYLYATSINKPFEVVTKIVSKTKPGSGPRHLVFSSNQKYAYLINEFDGKVSKLNFQNGKFSAIQEISTAPQDFKGKIDGADIHISPDGKFLYSTNRGDLNTISLFSISKKGKLALIETVSTLGKGPRNFAIDPSGKYLLVAHQSSNDVVIFNRNATTGKLTDSGKKIDIGVPVCLVFSK